MSTNIATDWAPVTPKSSVKEPPRDQKKESSKVSFGSSPKINRQPNIFYDVTAGRGDFDQGIRSDYATSLKQSSSVSDLTKEHRRHQTPNHPLTASPSFNLLNDNNNETRLYKPPMQTSKNPQNNPQSNDHRNYKNQNNDHRNYKNQSGNRNYNSHNNSGNYGNNYGNRNNGNRNGINRGNRGGNFYKNTNSSSENINSPSLEKTASCPITRSQSTNISSPPNSEVIDFKPSPSNK